MRSANLTISKLQRRTWELQSTHNAFEQSLVVVRSAMEGHRLIYYLLFQSSFEEEVTYI
jgi:hypothetical protein